MSQPAESLQQPIRPAAHIRSSGWVLRRALLGIFALSVFVLSGAVLLHASIEPDSADKVDTTQSE